jgi:hypothetical protein
MEAAQPMIKSPVQIATRICKRKPPEAVHRMRLVDFQKDKLEWMLP